MRARLSAGGAAVLLLLIVLPARAQEAAKVAFFSPKEGSTVASGKIEVQLEVQGLRLVDAGFEVAPGEGHAHIFIDREPVKAGEAIPTDDPSIIHMGKFPYESRSIRLTPGKHTLWAGLADSGHKALDPFPTAKVSFNVANDGFRGKAPIQLCAVGVAEGQNEILVVFPPSGGLLQGSVTSHCGFKTEGGACDWVNASFRRVRGDFRPPSTLSGEVLGLTERRLVSGPASCGASSKSDLPPQPLTGSFVDGRVKGTLGQASFDVASDPEAEVLPPAEIAPTPRPKAGTPKPTAADDTKGASGGGSLTPVIILALLVIGGGGAFAVVRSRRSRPASSIREAMSRPVPPQVDAPVREPTPTAVQPQPPPVQPPPPPPPPVQVGPPESATSLRDAPQFSETSVRDVPPPPETRVERVTTISTDEPLAPPAPAVPTEPEPAEPEPEAEPELEAIEAGAPEAEPEAEAPVPEPEPEPVPSMPIEEVPEPPVSSIEEAEPAAVEEAAPPVVEEPAAEPPPPPPAPPQPEPEPVAHVHEPVPDAQAPAPQVQEADASQRGPAPRFCPNCGAERRPQSRFCTYCGHPL